MSREELSAGEQTREEQWRKEKSIIKKRPQFSLHTFLQNLGALSGGHDKEGILQTHL